MNTQVKHTPTPWELKIIKDDDGIADEIIIFPAISNFAICLMGITEDAKANAHLIVKSVNSHEALVEALNIALERLQINNCEGEEDRFIKQIEQALKKAGEL